MNIFYEAIGKGATRSVIFVLVLTFVGLALLSNPWWAAPLGCLIGCSPALAILAYVVIRDHIERRNYNKEDA